MKILSVFTVKKTKYVLITLMITNIYYMIKQNLTLYKTIENDQSIFGKFILKNSTTYYESYFKRLLNETNINHDLDELFYKYLNDTINLESKLVTEYFDTFKKLPPTNYAKWIEFAVSNGCPLHPAYYAQIGRDLKPFRKKKNLINENKISEARMIFNKLKMIRIKNNTIYDSDYNYTDKYYLFTTDLLRIFPADKEIVFLYNFHDNPKILQADIKSYMKKQTKYYKRMGISKYNDLAYRGNVCLNQTYKKYRMNTGYLLSNKLTFTELYPIFSSCKTICHNDILIPGFHHVKEIDELYEDQVPWENKEKKLVWRGSTTGVGWSEMGIDDLFRNFQRMRFVEWSMKRKSNKLPFKMDIGFSSARNCMKKVCKLLKHLYEFKNFINYTHQQKSKYMFTIDGHTWSSRFQAFLFSKSLVFQSTYFIEWFSFLAKPWIHYVPVDLSLDDLENHVLWAYYNDEQARQIAERANQLAKKHLTFEGMQCYAGLLLLEYSDLLDIKNFNDIV
jgi:hypothetical protein